MSGTLKNIGENLKARRQEMNLSLREVENATSIRSNHLQAIEEGQMDKLISHIYAQGFVKQYAVFLGMDGEKIVKEHADLFKSTGTQEFAYGIGTLEPLGSSGSSVGGLNLGWILGLAGILAVAWLLARYLEIL